MPLKPPTKKRSTGFVLLYSVIITTVLLIIGVSLMNIITKQLVISSISRNSKLASYAALAGNECAEYWKNANGNYFGKIDNDGSPLSPPNTTQNPIPIACPSKSDITFLPKKTSSDNNVTEFLLRFPRGIALCADVKVTFDPDNKCGQFILIESRGYNVDCDNIATPNPRRVESVYSDRVLIYDSTTDTCR